LQATAIQQNGIGGDTPLLAIQPIKNSGLRLEQLGLARDIAGGTLYIVGNQAIRCLRLGAGASRNNRGKRDLHANPCKVSSVNFVTELADFVTEFGVSSLNW
jgi:hypothetical protein